MISQWRRSLLRGPQRPLAILTLVVLGSGIHVSLAVAQHGVDDSGQLVRRRRDSFGRSQLGFLAAQKGTEGAVGAMQGIGRQPQCRSRPVGAGLGPGADDPPSGYPVVGTQTQPRGEMLGGGPSVRSTPIMRAGGSEGRSEARSPGRACWHSQQGVRHRAAHYCRLHRHGGHLHRGRQETVQPAGYDRPRGVMTGRAQSTPFRWLPSGSTRPHRQRFTVLPATPAGPRENPRSRRSRSPRRPCGPSSPRTNCSTLPHRSSGSQPSRSAGGCRPRTAAKGHSGRIGMARRMVACTILIVYLGLRCCCPTPNVSWESPHSVGRPFTGLRLHLP